MDVGRHTRALARSLAVAALLIGLLEVAARLLAPAPETGILAHRPLLKLYPGLADAEAVFSGLDREQLEWAPYLQWVARPGLSTRFFHTDAMGFRGAGTAVPKPAGRFRIAVLGGSVAWGLGCTSDERTVPARLQALLRQRFPELGVEVVNAAQAGFVSSQELIYFHRTVAAVEPDLVLLFDGYNDVEADFGNPVSDWPPNAAHLKRHYEEYLHSSLGTDLARALGRSRLVQLVRASTGARPSGPWRPAVRPEDTGASYARNATAIARLARPAPVWVALQPVLATTTKPLAAEEQQMLQAKERQVQDYTQRVRGAYAAMEERARGAGLPVIRLDDALGTEPRLLFADECHFADEGAARVAAALAAGLQAGGALRNPAR